LHHRRNVPLAKDAYWVRRGNTPQVLVELNTTVIGIIVQNGEQDLPTAQWAFAMPSTHACALTAPKSAV
jgi:hypothetical protein